MILSILTASIPSRKYKLERLSAELKRQRNILLSEQPELGAELVEILHSVEPSYLDGGASIGERRQSLLDRATGEYCLFQDDDDNIAPNYLETLILLCKQGEDVATFRSIVKTDGYWTVINMSLENETNEEAHPRGIVQRTPWHICPIRRVIATMHRFNPLNHNEDFDWVQRVLPYLQTEAHSDMILTQYNHSTTGSEADKIVKHEASTNY